MSPNPQMDTSVELPALRVMIAGGGTGGHLFPGVALAERVRDAGGEVCFVGTQKGIEARVLPEEGWPLELMSVSGIKGRGVRGLVTGLAKLPGAYFQSRRIIKSFSPDVVVGVGGYASGPIVMTARSMGLPTAILEQNSVPGVTNRILGKVVHRVYTAFSDAAPYFPKKKVRRAGNPIRKELLGRLSGSDSASGEGGRAPRLFVFGGSQGARAINNAVVAALPALLEAHPGLELWHQTGRADELSIKAGYADLGLDSPRARVVPFIKDMSEPYSWCDLVLCRAGATSVSELAAVGCPAILVPFPQATDNHQEHNARELVDSGAARMVLQDELQGAQWAEMVASLLGDEDSLSTMRTAMRAAARPQAAETILADLAQLLA
jgi:UDP-N-acetylglucosamine--N-acetylmuramyl-(pentapeptide) pyrophosphoryl-undecaprenol N-acetylglucosamine transferase